ncbi:hypothetical protein DICVIV_03684 [Dictyocaulus viviparus]|uniref:Uncharacterized protein n=1 Tax=Dictyocaulus viviparus TaxID=29172 RepID=A0A0D8Y6I5_DICVI|nr:hypothetical protein DICVIV_03684 [Dictyocaulus viviparus]
MIQCDTDGCFCVAAHNGLIAFDTRTNSTNTFPHCSNCYKLLKQLFAHGDPPKGTFIPKCDVAYAFKHFLP